jgi:hypothetical protein
MPLKTTTNATIACNKGSKPANMQVTSQTHSKIDGVLIATEKDKEFPSNIQPFGRCSLLWTSCKCTPTKWEKTLKSKINGNKKLSKDSFMMCGVGGKITFVDTGANQFSKSESAETPIISTQKEEKTEEKTEEQIEKEKNKENIVLIIVVVIFFVIVLSIILLG